MRRTRATHLYRRGAAFYLRRRVPVHLVAAVGCAELKASLGTSNIALARQRHLRAALWIEQLFERVGSEPLQSISSEIRQLVRRYFAALAQEDEFPGVAVGADANLQRNAWAGTAEEVKVDLLEQIDTGDFEQSVKDDAQRLASNLSTVSGEMTGAQFHSICEGVARARIESASLYQFRLSDRLAPYAPRDELFEDALPDALTQSPPAAVASAATITAAPAAGPTLGPLIDTYIEQQTSTGQWTGKTIREQKRVLGWLKDHIGAATPIADLTGEHLRTFRDGISALRRGSSKVTSFKERQTDNPAERISTRTAVKLFGFAKAFWLWLEKEDYRENMPGRALVIKGPKSKEPPRRPFTPDELQKLFSSPAFTQCHSGLKRHLPGTHRVRDAFYWIPILSLYTGARAGELVQLEFSDVQVDGPIPYLRITTASDDSTAAKSVKSTAGHRTVPLHPAVMKLGFAQFVAKRAAKANGKGRLFNDMPFGADGMASSVFSKKFGRYRRRVGLADPKITFHSFRHTFMDALRDNVVPDSMLKRLVGHADTSVSGQYGKGASLEACYEVIKAIKFLVEIGE